MAHTNPSTGLGAPANRIDGRAKVTGSALYAAEYKPDGLVFGKLVTSTITRGRILTIDSKHAEKMPGVLTVISHLNRPAVPGWEKPVAKADTRLEGQAFRVFYNDKIVHHHQPIALVIANTPERADEAARKIRVLYQPEVFKTELTAHLSDAVKPKRSKDYQRGIPNVYQSAPVRLEAVYTTPFQVHNPMEMHAAIAEWKDPEKVQVYNKTQSVKIAQKEIMTAFELPEENVHIHSPYVGGAFGSSSRVWPQEMAAILGAKKTGQPVQVMAGRDQVFNMVGYRPQSVQQFSIGANQDGSLVGITHEVAGNTSTYEEFLERIVDPTHSMYACPNMNTTYRLVPLDMSTPAWTRGPGETSGSFALESAIDELSYALHMDPLELRKKNFAETDPATGLPWSSNYLKECYNIGAEKFGWNKRNPMPRSMRSGEWLLGMGMGAGVYKAERAPAHVSVSARIDGTLLVQTSVADVGPGSATIMTQIAADAFGIDPSKIIFQWGDSSFPEAPGQFGSHTTASVGSAVYETVKALQQKLNGLAVNTQGSPFYGKRVDELDHANGIISTTNTKHRLSVTDLLKQHGLPELKVIQESRNGSETERFSGKSFCANYVEVLVHPNTGMVKVNKVVSVIDAGKIINHKTATSQVYGAVVWGIGIALMEEGIIDHRYGRYVNNNLADYHIPVNADIPFIDVTFIDKPDPVLNPIGAKGLGEIGLIGLTAAIANAVYHATGIRIRSLPITPDKVVNSQ